MRRTLATLLLLLGAMQAAGALPLDASDRCRDVCPGDEPDGDCPPFCDECICCAAPAAATAVEPEPRPAPAPTLAGGAIEPSASPQPAPREILHVPKPLPS